MTVEKEEEIKVTDITTKINKFTDDHQYESNKYNKNFILVLQTVQAYEHLFSDFEKSIMDTYVNKLSGKA